VELSGRTGSDGNETKEEEMKRKEMKRKKGKNEKTNEMGGKGRRG